MLPYLLIGAAIVVAYLALRPRARARALAPATVKIVVGGSPGDPAVKRVDPDPVDVVRLQDLIWDIDFEFGGSIPVSVRDVRPKEGPHFGDPFVGKESDRNNKNNPRRIRDRIRGKAKPDLYKYAIYLNNRLALDPDIRIREG